MAKKHKAMSAKSNAKKTPSYDFGFLHCMTKHFFLYIISHITQSVKAFLLYETTFLLHYTIDKSAKNWYNMFSYPYERKYPANVE